MRWLVRGPPSNTLTWLIECVGEVHILGFPHNYNTSLFGPSVMDMFQEHILELLECILENTLNILEHILNILRAYLRPCLRAYLKAVVML